MHGFLEQVPLQTDFAPTRSSVIPNAAIASHYGRSPEWILPAPDALHRPQLTLWRDGINP